MMRVQIFQVYRQFMLAYGIILTLWIGIVTNWSFYTNSSTPKGAMSYQGKPAFCLHVRMTPKDVTKLRNLEIFDFRQQFLISCVQFKLDFVCQKHCQTNSIKIYTYWISSSYSMTKHKLITVYSENIENKFYRCFV